MSNDTSYELEFSHPDKTYLQEALDWLSKKEPSWGFDIQVKPRKKPKQDYYYSTATSWANENASNMTMEDEMDALLEKYEEIGIDGTFDDEYGEGSFCGEKEYEKYYEDEEWDEDDE